MLSSPKPVGPRVGVSRSFFAFSEGHPSICDLDMHLYSEIRLRFGFGFGFVGGEGGVLAGQYPGTFID